MSSWIFCPDILPRVIIVVIFFSTLSLGHAAHGLGLTSKHHERRTGAQATLAIPTPLRHEAPGTNILMMPSDNPYNPFPSSQLPKPISSTSEHFLLSLQDIGSSGSELPDSSSVGTACGDALLVMGYYPDWVGSSFPPDKIDFTRFDWIDFAFAVPQSDFSLAWDDDNAPQLLKTLITLAHNRGTKVKLSIGGWTGSRYFSSAVASEQSRTIFVQNILSFYQFFGLDGIDIDWEYPGRQGAAGNTFHSTDSENFVRFLKLLRITLPPAAKISAAVETTTFIGPNGESMLDLSEFAEVLDWVLIMNYDVWGSSADPGPNAPLRDACGNSTQSEANAVSAYNVWTDANFPACKLVLGLPSYGYISSSTVEHLRTRSKSKKKHRQSTQSTGLTVVSEDGGDDSQVQFRELVKQGALVGQIYSTDTNGTNGRSFVASEGFERRWDDCSDTPFLRSTSASQIITYDDPESLGMKAAFAKEVGMLGVNLFDIHGDTDQWDLTNSIRKGVGLL